MSSTSGQLNAASASPMPPGITDPTYVPLPGRLGNLTVIQQHCLDKLRGELQAESHFVPERMDDASLLRWVHYRWHPVPFLTNCAYQISASSEIRRCEGKGDAALLRAMAKGFQSR